MFKFERAMVSYGSGRFYDIHAEFPSTIASFSDLEKLRVKFTELLTKATGGFHPGELRFKHVNMMPEFHFPEKLVVFGNGTIVSYVKE